MTLIGIELLRSLENPVKSHVERARTPFYVIVGKNIEIASFHIFDSRPRHLEMFLRFFKHFLRLEKSNN